MQTTLNTDLLATMLKNQRADKGLRAVAEEIGNVSAATLSRVEQGKIPDVDTFIKICKWLNEATDTFIVDNSKDSTFTIKDQFLAHLRADRELSNETVNMLISVINHAYSTK